MGTAQSLSFLAFAFSFPLFFLFGLVEGMSFGEIEPSWINYTSHDDRGFGFSFPSSWTVVNNTHKDNNVIT